MGAAGRLVGRLGLLVAVVAVAALGAADVAVAQDPVGTVLETDAPGAIPGSYIIVLNDPTERPGDLVRRYGGTVAREYHAAVRGFSARMTAAQAAHVAADPTVRYVEQNARVVLTGGVQFRPPSWGLDRIGQQALPLSGSYAYPDVASGVHAYVLDTGIRTSHVDFGGRASSGYDFIDNDATAQDCNGHGTHVAATLGGGTYGVAKAVRLVAVRVLDCSGTGTYGQIIAGVDWVTAHAVKPAVANMSLGGPASPALDDAVRASIASGVTYTVAAGNDNDDACGVSPADTTEALTVAASDASDTRASFSNYGTCVDLFAPGVDILSGYGTGDSTIAYLSGTSMATPHVAGAAALVLAAHPDYSPAQVSDALLGQAGTDRIGRAGAGTPNRLLYVGTGAAEPAPPPMAVAAPPPCWQAANGNRMTVRDRASVDSWIGVVACGGRAARTSQVRVTLSGGRRGDYQLDLIAPNGRAFRLKTANSRDRAGGLDATYRVNLSAVGRSGGWRLRVRDTRRGYAGTLAGWSLSL